MENFKIRGYKSQLIGEFLLLRETLEYNPDCDELKCRIESSDIPKKIMKDIGLGGIYILVLDLNGHWDGVMKNLGGWIHLCKEDESRVRDLSEAMKMILSKKSFF
jgi:hypothetical protein